MAPPSVPVRQIGPRRSPSPEQVRSMSAITPTGASTGGPNPRFNLSEWALNHRPLVLFFIGVCALMGFLSYEKLGQSEDPPFTFKVMVIRTNWPGATARRRSSRSSPDPISSAAASPMEATLIEWL